MAAEMKYSKALSLEQFKRKVADQAPGFDQALEKESAHLAFCKETRESLRQFRDDLSISQKDLAAKMQMSQPGVSKIENGEGDLGLMTLSRYAEALGLRPSISFVPIAAGETDIRRDRGAKVAGAVSIRQDLALGAAMRTELHTFEAGSPRWAAARDLLGDQRMMAELLPTIVRTVVDSYVAGRTHAVARSSPEGKSPETETPTEGKWHGSAG
jgi:transcriptional regulator with XRE-family HTH domain